MHTDERAKLREEFLTFFNEKYWLNYEKEEKKICLWVNIFFRTLHVLVLISVLGIAFACARSYIPKKWWMLSLALALCWIVVEYVNLKRIDNWLLRNSYKNLLTSLSKDSVFLEYVNVFEKKDICPSGFTQKLIESLNIKTAPLAIEKIRQLLYYLHSVKSFDEQEHEFDYEKNTHIPASENLFD